MVALSLVWIITASLVARNPTANKLKFDFLLHWKVANFGVFVAVSAPRDRLAAIFGPTGVFVQDVSANTPFQIHNAVLFFLHVGLIGLGGAEAPPC